MSALAHGLVGAAIVRALTVPLAVDDTSKTGVFLTGAGLVVAVILVALAVLLVIVRQIRK